MERYEAYKDSGVEWIGKIPHAINFLRTRYSLRFVKGKLPAETNEFGNGVPYIGAADLDSDCECSTYTVDDTLPKAHVDDLLVLWDGARAGICGTGREGAISSTVVKVIPSFGIYKPFLYWYYKAFEPYILEQVHGTTIPHMNRSYFDDIGILSWSMEEQRAIADYLDAKTVEIDGLVADCEREVKLLQEYRKAVISEAVTKGLDSNVPMKDSGVEWIGEIPEHWGAGKLLRHARLESGHTPSKQHPEWWLEDECTIPWVTTGDVHRFRDGRLTSIVDTVEHVSQVGLDNSSARLLPAGTVALSRTASVGFSIVLGEPMASSQDFADWVPDDELDSFYLLYSLRSMGVVFRQLQMGSTHKTIYMPDIIKLAIAFPPIEEQRGIVAHLDAKTAEIDSLIEMKKQMADKLRDYRKSLISEAVTGKFKVSGVD